MNHRKKWNWMGCAAVGIVFLGTAVLAEQGEFVETTYGDPDWVFATGDHILRADLCEPFEWYDRIMQAPCWPQTRFWKLSETTGNCGIVPMHMLGTGTFDGLFVRSGATFLLHDSQGNPVSSAMTGPKYVSVDYWIPYAPAGFEPGTFLVSGGQGALGNYSITIWTGANPPDSDNDGLPDDWDNCPDDPGTCVLVLVPGDGLILPGDFDCMIGSPDRFAALAHEVIGDQISLGLAAP